MARPLLENADGSGRAAGVAGSVVPGFEAVAHAFAENVLMRGETGASCAVYLHGQPVVDLWVARNEDAAWGPETRTVVFSVSKGVTTICLLMAAERGLLDLDAPVASYWPEFGVNGKQFVTARQVLAHRAGLPWPEGDLTVADLQAWQPVVESLARQRPAWDPGTAFAYHALTVGWLAGEILRRTTGLLPSKWLAEHMAGPLGLPMRFGVDVNEAGYQTMREPLPVVDLEAAAKIQELIQTDPRVVRTFHPLDPADLFDALSDPEVLRCELPAGNLVTNARSLAKLYAATLGEVDGIRLLGAATVDDARRVQSEGSPFLGLDEGLRWGTGFMLDSPKRRMAGPGSFGHDGAGGHVAFAHPETGIAFGYNTSRPGGLPDDRAEDLCEALRTALAGV